MIKIMVTISTCNINYFNCHFYYFHGAAADDNDDDNIDDNDTRG